MTEINRLQILNEANSAAWEVRGLLLLTEFVCDKLEYLGDAEQAGVIDGLSRITRLLIPRIEVAIDALDHEIADEIRADNLRRSDGGAA